MADSSGWSWTAPQRRALIALMGAAALILGVEALRRPVYVGPHLPPGSVVADSLADKINPNTAPAAVLATLPEIGLARAQRLVAYRRNFIAAHPGRPAFTSPADLMRVKGIGPAIATKLTPYLSFKPSADSLQP